MNLRQVLERNRRIYRLLTGQETAYAPDGSGGTPGDWGTDPAWYGGNGWEEAGKTRPQAFPVYGGAGVEETGRELEEPGAVRERPLPKAVETRRGNGTAAVYSLGSWRERGEEGPQSLAAVPAAGSGTAPTAEGPVDGGEDGMALHGGEESRERSEAGEEQLLEALFRRLDRDARLGSFDD